jgi:hypothetical protein
MATINPDRQVIGISDAMDWPQKGVVNNAFYLLVLGQRPITGKSFWSAAIPVVVHELQWVWLIAGSDLTQGKVGRSRGDRYRTNLTMRGELLQANYAWWCEKQEWSVTGNTPNGLALTPTELSPIENVWWTPLTFLNRMDKDTGVAYGAASVQLTDMTAEITV